MRTGLNDLPEPAALHAWLSADHPLDWGDPLPAKAEISERYGVAVTARSLELLVKAAEVEKRITGAVVSAIGDEAAPYHLANRLKSPHSLARKLAGYQDFYRRPDRVPEDVLRYTAAVKHPDELVAAAVRTIDRLRNQHCQVEAAHHSYVDGSRYKGLHALVRAHGERIELQVHTAESIQVKETTTPLYEIERDHSQDPEVRDGARRECITLSDRMTQPQGIDELQELGGRTVRSIRYGEASSRKRSDAVRHPGEPGSAEHGQQSIRSRQKGITR